MEIIKTHLVYIPNEAEEKENAKPQPKWVKVYELYGQVYLIEEEDGSLEELHKKKFDELRENSFNRGKILERLNKI